MTDLGGADMGGQVTEWLQARQRPPLALSSVLLRPSLALSPPCALEFTLPALMMGRNVWSPLTKCPLPSLEDRGTQMDMFRSAGFCFVTPLLIALLYVNEFHNENQFDLLKAGMTPCWGCHEETLRWTSTQFLLCLEHTSSKFLPPSLHLLFVCPGRSRSVEVRRTCWFTCALLTNCKTWSDFWSFEFLYKLSF